MGDPVWLIIDLATDLHKETAREITKLDIVTSY